METNEKIIFSNTFGSVTDKRIILNYKEGSEDLPIGQVTSISYKHRRNYFFAIGSFIVAVVIFLVLLSNLSRLGGLEAFIVLFFVLILSLSGIANWIGHHNIVISSGGKDRKPLKTEMSKTKEGRDFTDAVKRAVIK